MRASPPIDPKSVAGKTPAVERHVQLLVIGAGPAGIAAAAEAAARGLEVLLVDENPVDGALIGMDVPLHFGGRATAAVNTPARLLEPFLEASPELAELFDKGVEVMLQTTVWGLFANGPGVQWMPGAVAGLADAERSWLVGFDKVVVAAGRRDLGMSFPGWDLPGVVGVTAAHRLIANYDAFAGRRLLILGTGAEALDLALTALGRGLEVAGLVEVTAEPVGPAALVDAVQAHGVPILTGHVIKAATGGVEGVTTATLVRVDGQLSPVAGSERDIACDTIALGIGTVPNIELLAALDARLVHDPDRGGHVPVTEADGRTALPFAYAVGDCAGIHAAKSVDAAVARQEGRVAAIAAAASLGKATEAEVAAARAGLAQPVKGQGDLRMIWLKALLNTGGLDVLVCQCEEVSRGELLDVSPPRYLERKSNKMGTRSLATLLEDGPVNQDQVKRLTRAGMGLCQGRRCREQVAMLLALASRIDVGQVPLASYRPPVRPLPLKVLWPQDEAEVVRQEWDSWFGIESQWMPWWEIPTGEAKQG
ncbi:FAD-dependent oxidoreductase [Inquilinus limosus]|uniref:FAD-dependent oxidoreductase n=1 Tax=Inquilinus limosus TaxID=171674 RepID=UPI003F182A13